MFCKIKYIVFKIKILNIYNYSNQNSSTTCYRCSGGIYFRFVISTGCTDISSICAGIVNLLGSSRKLFEATFVVFSAIIFPTRSPFSPAGF